MLDARQAAIAAYMANGGFYHVHCAQEIYGDDAVEFARVGHPCGPVDVSPISRYDIDTYAAETEHASALDEDREPDYETSSVHCDHCGEEI